MKPLGAMKWIAFDPDDMRWHVYRIRLTGKSQDWRNYRWYWLAAVVKLFA